MAKIEIQDGDDWLVVKIDGKKYQSGHSLSNRDIVDLLKHLGHDASESCGNFRDDDEDDFVPDRR